jgi:hypothetical protein
MIVEVMGKLGQKQVLEGARIVRVYADNMQPLSVAWQYQRDNNHYFPSYLLAHCKDKHFPEIMRESGILNAVAAREMQLTPGGLVIPR